MITEKHLKRNLKSRGEKKDCCVHCHGAQQEEMSVFFKPVDKTRFKKVVFFSHGLTLWVNDKVWELVTYCTGALLDCVYILNYY